MHDLIAIDLETSGLDPRTDHVLAIGAATWNGATFYRLVMPPRGLFGWRKKVGAGARRVNGYDEGLWQKKGAVEAEEAADSFALWINQVAKEGARRPLAHNAGFDRSFIEALSERTDVHFNLNRRWECSCASLSFAQRAGIAAPGPASLDQLARISGQDRPPVHDALEDAVCCLRGYATLIELMKQERTSML